MVKTLTLKEVARQLCDGLDMNLQDIENKLGQYVNDNPMSLEKLNELCWADSNKMFSILESY